jgi:drug/metabolite transporter (DMT)-like permease
MSWRALVGLGIAVLAVSFGAPLARLTDAAPLAVAMWRMSLAAGLLLPVAAGRGTLAIPRQHRPAALLAGLFLGLHFGLWIPSLWLTSVSASVVLVTTAPLFVLALSPHFLGTRVGVRNLASFALAATGVVVIVGGDFHLSPRALAGDVMALGGAACGAAYLVVGKRLRREVPLVGYLGVVYTVAAATLILAVAALRVEPWPATGAAWLPLLGLALGPTLVGHSLLNWALAHLEAYRVNLALLLEPVLATVWTWLFIGEAPPLHVVPGAMLVLGALAMEYVPGRRTT